MLGARSLWAGSWRPAPKDVAAWWSFPSEWGKSRLPSIHAGLDFLLTVSSVPCWPYVEALKAVPPASPTQTSLPSGVALCLGQTLHGPGTHQQWGQSAVPAASRGPEGFRAGPS